MKILETKSGYKIIPVLRGRSNVFLVAANKQCILIDTSVRSKWNKLKERLNELNIQNIDVLILTHTHFDHAGNAKKIKDKYNPQVIVHKNGADYLTSGDNIIPNGTNLFTRILIFLFARIVFPKWRYEPCGYDILADSYFDLKKMGLNAYLTESAGHSIDSMSLVIDNEIAIVGDAMFGVFKSSVMPPYGTDSKQLVNSWGKLLDTGCKIYLPGHGNEINRAVVEREYNKRNMASL